MKSAIVMSSNWQRIILLIVLAYEAAGGMLGGILLILAPDGHLMEMPVRIMHGAFPDFLIPGIILLSLGILNAFAFLSVLHRSNRDWFMAGLAMGGFYLWFVVEIIILRELHWLHLMWGLPVLLGWIMIIPLIALRNAANTMHQKLLICGVLSSLWYIAINIIIPFFYKGYSTVTFTVSELSAINAPTRILWVLLATVYPVLFAAFGWGVLRSPGNRRLRIVGGFIIAYSLFNLYWPPMHMRGMTPSLTDTLHIIWASVTVLLMMLMMGFASAALDVRFRLYTIISLALLLFFGVLTFTESPNIPTNAPTPTIGIWERINIAIFMLWIIVFAGKLLKNAKSPTYLKVVKSPMHPVSVSS